MFCFGGFPSPPLKRRGEGQFSSALPQSTLKFDRETSQGSQRHEITRAIHFIWDRGRGKRGRGGEGDHSARGKRGQFFVFAREKFSGGRNWEFQPRRLAIPQSSQIISKFGRNRISVRRSTGSKSITRSPPPRERPVRGVEQAARIDGNDCPVKNSTITRARRGPSTTTTTVYVYISTVILVFEPAVRAVIADIAGIPGQLFADKMVK